MLLLLLQYRVYSTNTLVFVAIVVVDSCVGVWRHAIFVNLTREMSQ